MLILYVYETMLWRSIASCCEIQTYLRRRKIKKIIFLQEYRCVPGRPEHFIVSAQLVLEWNLSYSFPPIWHQSAFPVDASLPSTFGHGHLGVCVCVCVRAFTLVHGVQFPKIFIETQKLKVVHFVQFCY